MAWHSTYKTPPHPISLHILPQLCVVMRETKGKEGKGRWNRNGSWRWYGIAARHCGHGAGMTTTRHLRGVRAATRARATTSLPAAYALYRALSANIVSPLSLKFSLNLCYMNRTSHYLPIACLEPGVARIIFHSVLSFHPQFAFSIAFSIIAILYLQSTLCQCVAPFPSMLCMRAKRWRMLRGGAVHTM